MQVQANSLSISIWNNLYQDIYAFKFYFSFYCHRDRFRTAVNVLGDSYGAGIVEHLSRHDLKYLEDVNLTVGVADTNEQWVNQTGRPYPYSDKKEKEALGEFYDNQTFNTDL